MILVSKNNQGLNLDKFEFLILLIKCFFIQAKFLFYKFLYFLTFLQFSPFRHFSS